MHLRDVLKGQLRQSGILLKSTYGCAVGFRSHTFSVTNSIFCHIQYSVSGAYVDIFFRSRIGTEFYKFSGELYYMV